MGELRESVLLCKALKFVVVPLIIISLLASFFPFIQVLTPVHEGTECICYYLHENDQDNGRYRYPLLYLLRDNKPMAANVLLSINVTMFYLVNWLFLFINIRAIFRIRKMNDKLFIRQELSWVVGIWSFFDFFQYIFY